MPAKRILQAVFVEAAGAEAASLPDELLERALPRQRALVLGFTVLFALGIPLRWLAWRPEDHRLFLASSVVSGVFATLGLLTFVALRYGSLKRQNALFLGLVFEVLLCFALALVEQVLVGFSPMPFRISLVALVLLTFPLIVPTPPRWRLIATVLAALTQPLALLVVAAIAGRFDLREIVATSAPTLLIASLAAWLANVIHRMRVDVGRALEFGQYELVRQLGEGGMGEVWEARHHKLLRPAAIKLIRPETAGVWGSSARARFHREAQATAALTSPHTVSLFDYGTTDDGTLYYAMERLEGVDLRSVVEEHGPLPASRVLAILEQVARSLTEAHELGLVHRDIKPANVFICRVGTDVDFVKVLDFGLVKPIQIAHDSAVSVAGAVSGTPGYVAPEVAGGGEIDGRADLYSLGCVAYFLLTGRPVFDERTRMELLTAHLSQDPTPPSQRAPDLDIPEEVDRLVLDLLERKPDERIPSARVLLERIVDLRRRVLVPFDAEAWWDEHLPELAHPRAPLTL